MDMLNLLSCKMSPSLVLTLSQMNPVHLSPAYLFKIHCNIIFPSAPSHSFRFSDQGILSDSLLRLWINVIHEPFPLLLLILSTVWCVILSSVLFLWL